MHIIVEDLTFEAIIGILDFERKKAQKVIVNLTIDYPYQESYLDYAQVVNIIKTTMIEKKYLLIEDALLDLSKILKEKFSTINTLNLKITKPSILQDCRVSVAETYHFNS